MARQLQIGNTLIGDDTDCYVIAEIGSNHMGELERCKQLFKTAKECGASAVKLQKRDNRALFTQAMYDSPYDNENSFGDTYGTHRDALEFNWEQYQELQQQTNELGIDFFATAWDFPSADFLHELGVPAFKIASGDLINTPLLKYIAKFGKPMIVSTGGAEMVDVQRAVDAIAPVNMQLCLLQCTAAYPVEAEDMHLRVIETFRDKFPDFVIGLSDHQDGIAMSILAYALGARVFEKHFTLHRSWRGTDQAFSLEPGGMSRMVRDLQRARLALGNAEKQRYPSEAKPLMKMQKHIVAARDLPAGHVIRAEDAALKSPGGGIPPYEIDRLVGMVTTEAIPVDGSFLWENVAAK